MTLASDIFLLLFSTPVYENTYVSESCWFVGFFLSLGLLQNSIAMTVTVPDSRWMSLECS